MDPFPFNSIKHLDQSIVQTVKKSIAGDFSLEIVIEHLLEHIIFLVLQQNHKDSQNLIESFSGNFITVLEWGTGHVANQSFNDCLGLQAIKFLAFTCCPEQILSELLYDFIENEICLFWQSEGFFFGGHFDEIAHNFEVFSLFLC